MAYENLILLIHVMLAVGVVVFVLLQRGKGAEAGASFGGGASQTVFGSTGSGNFLTKTTAILVTGFFVTSMALAFFAKERADSLNQINLPIEAEQIPLIESEIPAGVDPVQDALPAE